MKGTLQDLSFDETASTLSVEVVFAVTGAQLDTLAIERTLATLPTRSWAAGEGYSSKSLNEATGKREPRQLNRLKSLWELSSSGFATSLRVSDHIQVILGKIEKGLPRLRSVVGDAEITVSIIKNSLNDVVDYEVDAAMLQRLLPSCKRVLFIDNHSESVKDII